MLKGESTTLAINVYEAVSLAKNHHCDRIFMDIKMHEMDGHEATARIKTFSPDVPIIGVSANAFDSDRKAALKAGCCEFFVKPVRAEELKHLINHVKGSKMNLQKLSS